MNSPVSPAPEQRFSDRVENYVRYRPTYPQAILPLLQQHTGLGPASIVADIGSGTGISAALLLQTGCTVHGVEPNLAMRTAAEQHLRDQPAFHSIPGTAQATTLPGQSVHLITAAQSFHWFDTPDTRAEFTRILRPGGHIALIWNERQLDSTPFHRDYEQLLLDYATDYAQVRHHNLSHPQLRRFFEGDYTAHCFPNAQRLDLPGLQGRLLSSSYAPAPGHPLHAPMLTALHRLFTTHQSDDHITLEYTTQVYLGR